MTMLVDWVALSLLPVWRLRTVAEQLRDGRDASDVLDEQCADRVRRSKRAPRADELRRRATDALARAAANASVPLAWPDLRYPAALSTIVDPPPVLWIRGDPAALERPSVAIVGSRAGSEYACAVAERLGFDLAQRGLTVTSGLARGVDAAAHRGAVRAGGPTIAVLGSGVDVIYPEEHTALASGIAGAGALVSEFVPGTGPRSAFFPRRNRVISGLSRAVVIVEAGEKSGSLITARCALEQGRDVLAVPGNVLNTRNRGGHALLRDGARLVESADDVLDELGLARPVAPAPSNPPDGAADTEGQRAAVDPVLACLPPGEPCPLDALAAQSGLSAARLLHRLFELEMRGLVRRAGGGRFVRVDSSC